MQTASARHLQSFALTLLLGVAGVLQAFALAWPFEGASYGQPIAALQLTSLALLAAVLDRSHSATQAFWRAWALQVHGCWRPSGGCLSRCISMARCMRFWRR